MSCQKLSDDAEYHKQNHARLHEDMELLKRILSLGGNLIEFPLYILRCPPSLLTLRNPW